jgi:predicted nucleotidyltransferase
MATTDPRSYTAAPFRNKRVPMRTIRSIASRIAKEYRPEKIILFGSYAYGRPSPASDIDMLVIMDSNRNEVEAAREILKDLPPQPFSIDLLVRSQATIDRRIELGDWFLKEVTSQGIALYERDHT